MKRRSVTKIVRNDEGATIVIVAALSIVLLGAAAMAIDISRFTYQRQLTQNALESGAQAGAFYLPGSPNAAIAAARSAARFVDGQSNPTITPYCVVPYTGVVPNTTNAKSYDSSTVSSYCTPGATMAQLSAAYAAVRCNSVICSFPCAIVSGATPTGVSCNTLGLAESRVVNYLFGPVMKVFSAGFGGSTNIAAACRGSGCARSTPNPMNVVVVADRTKSMFNSGGIDPLVTAIKGMLKVMTPSQQFVALSTMGPSVPENSCKVANAPSVTASNAKWVPVDFSKDYLTSPGVLNAASDLTQKGLDCIYSSGGSIGTFLASALKYAARYLLGLDTNNLSSLPTTRSTPVKQAIIFETDGAPYESTENLKPDAPASSTLSSSSTNVLENSGLLWNKNSSMACENFKQVATRAKARGILVITVGYSISGTTCGGDEEHSSGQSIAAVLAAAASDKSPGVPSAAASNGACSGTDIALENSDGDYFYCAASGSDMAGIFAAALNQLVSRSRFIPLP